MSFIASRLKRIKPSMTVGINVKANALRAEGKDVLVLAAGEPDFDTPANIEKLLLMLLKVDKQDMSLEKALLHFKKQFKQSS